jgi:DNA-directed RNA polymerase subunit M/transcription elongation factor TFIIS
MHFCSVCENMYYIRIDANDPNKLVYYCRKCGNEDALFDTDNVSIVKTNIKKSEQSFSHIINQYTKLDPSLPRTSKVLCPNKDCETNTHDKEREIIYIRYNDTDMKYVYLCSTCDTVWETNSSTF